MKLYEPDIPKRVRLQLVWFFLWLAVTGFGIYLTPSSHGHGTHQQLGLPPCPTVLAFNRPCPGCGLTTSWTAILHGDLLTAFRSNWLGIPMYAAFTFVGIGTLIGNIKNQRMMIDTDLANKIIIAGIALFFAYGLTRLALTDNYASTQKEQWIRSMAGKK